MNSPPFLTSRYTRAVLMWLFATAVLTVAGQYAGAALFFKLTDISLEHVHVFALMANWQQYGHVLSLRPLLQVAMAVSMGMAVLPTLLLAVFALKKKAVLLHGDAKWATTADLKK